MFLALVSKSLRRLLLHPLLSLSSLNMASTEDPRESVAIEQQRARKILAEASENKMIKKSAHIVKYVVEHIYQELKNDLGSDDIGRTQLGRVKVGYFNPAFVTVEK